jgi:hypothetical protein
MECQLRGRAKDRQGSRRQGSVVGPREYADDPSVGGTIMGTEASNSVVNSESAKIV